MAAPEPAPSRLARRLGVGDAVVVGLGSMLGAGVFAGLGPAARAAGASLVWGLVLAASVAWCNATSSAQLAAVHPESGGTYVYGRRRLGRHWGVLAGWAFLSGKIASCAAMALTFAAYVAPSAARPLAVAAVAGVAAVNLGGIRRTAAVTRVVVVLVLGVLAVVVVASLFGGTADLDRLDVRPAGGGPRGVLQAGGLLFFAFAGYARIATLGEEVIDPGRTIPRAIPLALGLTLAVYAAVAVSALAAVGPVALADAPAPLAAAVAAGELAGLVPVVQVGAAVASLGVLLALVAGVGRTLFAMAADGELPRWLATVDGRHRVPARAELVVAGAVVVVVAVADVGEAIGFSSCNVLAYYAITNASALRLGPGERRWRPSFAVGGLVGCAVLALSLPVGSLITGLAVLAVGAVVLGLRPRWST